MTKKPQTLRALAKKKGRTYTTPEDVSASLDSGRTVAQVQQEFLEFVGGLARGFGGCEDVSCGAFVAARAGRRQQE